jgi:hypothetical protein
MKNDWSSTLDREFSFFCLHVLRVWVCGVLLFEGGGGEMRVTELVVCIF